jgi:RNA polymerase sigma-70 factor (ECF subfamily)
LPPEDAPDPELIVRSAGGDRAAFEILVSRHERAVFRLARTITQTNEDAEDVLQETFLSAFRGAGTFRASASVRTWLLTIARHAAIRHETRAARLPAANVDAANLGIDAGWGSDPESLVIRAQQHEHLKSALESLSPQDREILVLRDLEGVSGDDVASLLAMSRPAMKSRLHRARLRLLGRLRADHAAS